MTDLIGKQARFVCEYLANLNAKQVAIRAGSSRRSAELRCYKSRDDLGAAARAAVDGDA